MNNYIVFIVEDDDSNRELVEKVLKAEGYQVVWGFGFDDTVIKIKECKLCFVFNFHSLIPAFLCRHSFNCFGIYVGQRRHDYVCHLFSSR